MATNPRFSVQPQAGRPLPANWQQNAPKRAAMADAAYRFNLENAWRQGHESPDPNVARSARLSNPGRPLNADEQAMRNRLSSNKPLDWNELLGQQ